MLTGSHVLLTPLTGLLLKAIHDRVESVPDSCPISSFPSASSSGKGSWQPSFDMIRPQPGNNACEAGLNVAF